MRPLFDGPHRTSLKIISRQNPLVKELRALRDDRSSSLLFLEGYHLVMEALRSGLKLEILVMEDRFPDSDGLRQAKSHARKAYLVSSSVFRAVASVDTPSGILAVAEAPAASWETLTKKSPAPLVILDGIQDPGNAGAIVRTAEAAGAAGVITLEGTARLFSPKALRAAMGSSLRLPLMEHRRLAETAERCRSAGYRLVGACGADSAQATVRYDQADWKTPVALVLGAEGRGLDPAWEPYLEQSVKIPMEPPVESLNVAVAAAVLLYESRRRRNSGN